MARAAELVYQWLDFKKLEVKMKDTKYWLLLGPQQDFVRSRGASTLRGLRGIEEINVRPRQLLAIPAPGSVGDFIGTSCGDKKRKILPPKLLNES